MASQLRQENINGYQVAVCQNSQGQTFYLYQTAVEIRDSGKNAWVWHRDKPGSQNRVLEPAVMPSGFSLAEASENQQPILVKK